MGEGGHDHGCVVAWGQLTYPANSYRHPQVRPLQRAKCMYEAGGLGTQTRQEAAGAELLVVRVHMVTGRRKWGEGHLGFLGVLTASWNLQ